MSGPGGMILTSLLRSLPLRGILLRGALALFLGVVLLLAGCDSGIVSVQPEQRTNPEAEGHQGKDVLAQIQLRIDPSNGTIHEVSSTNIALSKDVINQYLQASDIRCPRCNDGITGPHDVFITLTPKIWLANVEVETPRCLRNCTYISHDPVFLFPPILRTQQRPFTVRVTVNVPDPDPFEVRFNVLGELVKVEFCLLNVSFVNDHTINVDGSRDIIDPVWTDNDCNRRPEKNEPVADTKNDNLEMRAQIKVEVIPALDEPLTADFIATTAFYPLDFFFVDEQIPGAGGTILVTGHSSQRLRDHVHVIDQLSLEWFAEIHDPTGAPPIRRFATSKHLIYVLFRDPTTTVYLTLLDHTTRNAHGQMNEQIIFNKIWSEFKDLMVFKRVLDSSTGKVTANGPLLTYWKTNPGQCGATSTVELLQQIDGQCGAWADHLEDALATHGISSQVVQVAPTRPGYAGFFVKNWQFNETPPACGQVPWTIDFNEIMDLPGVPGQGGPIANPNPFSIYALHYLVQYANAYYDPSYGKGPYQNLNLLQWENENVAGFFRDDLCIKRDTTGFQEIFVSP